MWFSRVRSGWLRSLLAISLAAGAPLLALSGRSASAAPVLTQEAYLVSPDTGRDDHMGEDVAISGDTLVAGAAHTRSFSDPNVLGAAYVFVRTGDTWAQQARLLASDGAPQDGFGEVVAISGDTIVVGSRQGNRREGTVYVFVRSGDTWTERAKLRADDGEVDDYFGSAVAVYGRTILVGAFADNTADGDEAGSVYVFGAQGSTWVQRQHLFADDAVGAEFFGWSLAVDGNTALVGARLDDTAGGSNAGSVYVFSKTNGHWSQTGHLLASDGGETDVFGSSIALSGNTALVGAEGTDTDAGIDSGSAYFFVRSHGVWTEQAHILGSEEVKGDYFGIAVALEGPFAIVSGRHHKPNGQRTWSAFLFVRSHGSWTEVGHLPAPQATKADVLGASLAISGQTVVAGARHDDTPSGIDSGSAYVFGIG